MIVRILFFICTITLFASCASTNKTTAVSDSPRLIFGNGGGFTGAYTIFELKADRRVFALLPDSAQHQVKRISNNQAKALFAQADKLRASHPSFNYPGNMTWFIQYHVNNEIVEYKWGDTEKLIPSEVKDFYTQLIELGK